jgi:hypothetical protein
MILTHYHHECDRPFQNLAAVSDEKALNIIASLQARTGAVYRRFNNPAKYLSRCLSVLIKKYVLLAIIADK